MDTTIRSAAGPSSPSRPLCRHFVHLKVHSAYSLLEGAITIPRLAKLAAAQGFPAVGLTDTNNLFGALEFSDKLAEAGIQPIVGCTLQVDFGDRPQANGLQRHGANQPRSQPAGALALLACDDARLAEPHEAGLAAPSSIPPRTSRRISRSSGWRPTATA